MKEIKQYIKNLIEQKLGVTLDTEVDYSTDLSQLGADGLDTIEIIVAIEKHYNIILKENYVERFSVNTLAYLVDLENGQ